MEITTGILLGLSTILFLGPVFFYLVKSTLEHGIIAGLAVALGIIIGDIIYVILVLKGFSTLLDNPVYTKWLSIAGGLLLVIMGLSYLLKKSPIKEIEGKYAAKSFGMYALNGFILNFINPFVLAVWIGFLTINEAIFHNQSSVMVSLGITLLVIFATDCLKVVFATKLKPLINAKKLKAIYKVFGSLMILFGIRLLLNG
jgi:threonine/homoserine/homoserine lactone efflux protein